MTSRTSSPELAAAVARVRSEAARTGELRTRPAGSPASPLPADARQAVVAWHRSGDYDRIVTELVADDPDLATQ